MASSPRRAGDSRTLLVLNEGRDSGDVVWFERVSCSEENTGDESSTETADDQWESVHRVPALWAGISRFQVSRVTDSHSLFSRTFEIYHI
jgi:hypothetical protein